MRVLIVDDNGVVRAGLRAKLGQMPAVKYVAEAADGVAALAILAEESFDVVLLDVRMPRMNGLEVLDAIKDTPVIMLSNSEDETTVKKAVSSGASGYLTFSTLSDTELESALNVAVGGGFILSSVAAAAMSGDVGMVLPLPGDISRKTQELGLTPREGEVCHELSLGLSNEQIAERLELSPRTVRNHLFSICTKLNVSSRGEVVAVWLGIRDRHEAAAGGGGGAGKQSKKLAVKTAAIR
ncbi:MAG: response regulator transcription factor [Propionibacteriaceae bacterium]|jgi:DNA-binding NarL/FixJ family response regulator|nr:response regulator transcription factor [Propionibacteriaceae bacterium]